MGVKLLPLILPLLLTPAAVAQVGTLDQQSPFGNASFNFDAASLTWQQQVRAGIGGTLEGFTLMLTSPAGAPGSVGVAVRLGGGWSASPVLYSGTANTTGLGAYESVYVDCSAAGITLAPNEVFVLEFLPNGSGVNAQGAYVAPPGTPPYAEPLFLNGSSSVYAGGGWNIGFETYMLTGPPPLTLSLNGSCPGLNVVSVANATAGGLVAIASGLSNTPSAVPNGPCAGIFIGMSNPALRLLTAADGNGNLSVPNANVPSVACGNAYLQALDVASCQVSNLVAL